MKLSFRSFFQVYRNTIFFAITLFLITIVSFFNSLSRPILYLDESSYLHRGVLIVEEKRVPSVPDSVGVSLIHALSYLLVRDHPLGVDFAGRITAFVSSLVMYIGIFLSVRRELGNFYGFLAAFMSLTYFPTYNLNRNSSDMLFAVCESILLFLLVSLNPRVILHLVVLSTVTAITTLVRNDGFLVFFGFSILIYIYLHRSLNRLSFKYFTAGWIIPYSGIILLVAFVSWRTTGVFEILPGSRTYIAFEQGSGLVRRFELEQQGKNPWIEGSRISEQLFGSSRDNENNVLRAVLNNPKAYVQRVIYNIRDFFLRWFEVHNGRIAVPVLLLTWFGFVTLLAKQKIFLFLSVCCFLFSSSPYFFLTFWRDGYIAMHAPLVIFLSVYAISQLPFTYSRLFKIFTGSFAVSLLLTMVILTSVYSGLLYCNWQGPIDGISSSEILGAILVLFTFLTPHRRKQLIWKTAGIFLVIGIWIGSIEALDLALSDKSRESKLNYTYVQNARRNYIQFAFENFRNTRVCTRDPSLPYYARQRPVLFYDSEINIQELADKYSCEYLLLERYEHEKLKISNKLNLLFNEYGIAFIRLKISNK